MLCTDPIRRDVPARAQHFNDLRSYIRLCNHSTETIHSLTKDDFSNLKRDDSALMTSYAHQAIYSLAPLNQVSGRQGTARWKHRR